jgi:hypothetical protein
MKRNILIFVLITLFWSCSVDSERGQAVGFATHFVRNGVFWKSWDLELNKSQTGMTSTAQELELSVDNDNEDPVLVSELDSAQKYGWKIQVDYVQRFGQNCMDNRGSSSKFIKSVIVLDKTPLGGIKDQGSGPVRGRIIDTIYLVIQKK